MRGSSNEKGVAHAGQVPDVGQRGITDQVGKFSCCEIGRNGQLNDREVTKASGDDLRADILGQLRLDAVNRLVNLLLREHEVGAVGERNLNQAEVGARRRRGGLDTRNALNGGLDRRRHVLVNDLGRCAGIRRQNGELRELYIRCQLLLERCQRQRAENGDHNRDKGDEGAVLHTGDGEEMHREKYGTKKRIVS